MACLATGTVRMLRQLLAKAEQRIGSDRQPTSACWFAPRVRGAGTTTQTSGNEESRLNVLLIGDSIRMNAEPFVRESLQRLCLVRSPPMNCESSFNVLKNLPAWLREPTEIVHINCGLHDIRYDPGNHHPVSSLSEYATNLNRIFELLVATGSSVIWATSTPINEDVHNAAKLSRRYSKDLIAYNRMSLELSARYGFHVNDMFGQLWERDYAALLLPDGIHFTPKGNQVVGDMITASILKCAGAQQSVQPDRREDAAPG